jgi:hypothetical protein
VVRSSASSSSATTLSAACSCHTRPVCSHHNNINNTEASKSDDAFRRANQFQPAYAKHDRLAPVAPLSLSLTAGEGEGRSKARHISCLFPAVLHARHARTHTADTHTFTPLASSFSHLFALGTGPGSGGLVLSGGPASLVAKPGF